jgi:hypothetical protein
MVNHKSPFITKKINMNENSSFIEKTYSEKQKYHHHSFQLNNHFIEQEIF